jgi:anti-sigma factor RsiW
VDHLSQNQIEDYSQQRLSAAELLTASDHLGECEACRRMIQSASNEDSAFFALHTQIFGEDAGKHLTPQQTAAYVDKDLAGESMQMVVDHLGTCEECSLAVEDLHAFRNELAPSLDREYRPAIPQPRDSWRQKFVALFRISPVPAFGGAALAVLLLTMIAWLVWRTPRTSEPEVVVTPTPISQRSPLPQPESAATETVSPTVVAQLNDGAGVLMLDQEGKLSGAGDLPPSYQNLLKKTLSSQRIDRSAQLHGLSRPPSSLMGSGDQKKEFSVLEPAGSVLLSTQPTFRWSALEGAVGYVVEIYDEQFKLAASSPQVSNLSWTTTLARGKVYSWQVKAIKEGQEITSPRPPAPQAKFRILDQAKANEIGKAKRAYASSHLTLALLYADAGLLKEAEQELRLLRRANPNSELARSLLRQVQTLRH